MTGARHILHLTDAHIKTIEQHDARSIKNALIADLKRISKGTTAPTLAVFTGDLAFSGSESEYAGALDTLLELLQAAGLDEKRFIMCPGNHDAFRPTIEARLSEVQSFRQRAETRTGANELLFDPTFKNYVDGVFKNYFDASEAVSGHQPIYSDCVCSSFIVDGIHIISTNTATLTTAGLRVLLKNGINERFS